MINDDRLQKALTYLAETDEPCAALRADMERAEFKAKVIREAIFMREDGTVAERNAKAGSHDEYKQAMNVYFDLLKLYEAMRNKRGTESIVIDTWRSLESSRRQGNVR